MCCSVKSEFVQALETLLAGDKQPDYILIETTGGCGHEACCVTSPAPPIVCIFLSSSSLSPVTHTLTHKHVCDSSHSSVPPAGMANPGPIAAALWTDEEVEAGVQLDSIVTVVDGININRQLHDKRAPGTVNEAQVQVGEVGVRQPSSSTTRPLGAGQPAGCKSGHHSTLPQS